MKKLLILLFLSATFFVGKAQTAQTGEATISVNLKSYSSDVTKISYHWTEVTNTGAIIVTPDTTQLASVKSASTRVTNIKEGTATFQCIATDNFGTASAPVQVTVTATRDKIPPVIESGGNQTIKLIGIALGIIGVILGFFVFRKK